MNSDLSDYCNGLKHFRQIYLTYYLEAELNAWASYDIFFNLQL